jgi:hypothetical protein
MRWRLTTLLVLALSLALPSSAIATLGIWTGESLPGPGAAYSITFTSTGGFSKKGRFLARRIGVIDATVSTLCFDSSGQVIPERPGFPHGDDEASLPFSNLRVGKRGRFAASQTLPMGGGSSIRGVIRKGIAHGTMQFKSGAVLPYCSSGTPADPTVTWQALLTPPTCPPVSAERRKQLDCVGP